MSGREAAPSANGGSRALCQRAVVMLRAVTAVVVALHYVLQIHSKAQCTMLQLCAVAMLSAVTAVVVALHVCLYVYVCVYVHVHIHYMYLYMCMYVYVYMYVYMYVYTAHVYVICVFS